MTWKGSYLPTPLALGFALTQPTGKSHQFKELQLIHRSLRRQPRRHTSRSSCNRDTREEKMKRKSLIPTVSVVLTFGMALIGATPLAAQTGCQPVEDAMNKVMTLPTHIYVAMTPVLNNGVKPRVQDTSSSETIYVGGTMYSKFRGSWSRGDWTPQQVMKQEQENRQKSKYSCNFLRNESVNGETAAVYNMHSERSDLGHITSDDQIWISKSKGLPLREEGDIDSGGPAGKHHHSVRYEYTNVQPPL
jgi:hypothetical protein